MPIRIQRRRTKGWKMPQNALYVGRPTPYGNPFDTAAAFRLWLNGEIPEHKPQREFILSHVKYLRGIDLACWCRPSEDCHADVLLEMANT
jgi:hypothetical protein